jgi:hypothetical protein
MEGFTTFFAGPEPDRDYRLITVWSAPNYSYRSANKASILGRKFDGKDPKELIIFGAAPEPIRITPASDEMPAASAYFQ